LEPEISIAAVCFGCCEELGKGVASPLGVPARVDGFETGAVVANPVEEMGAYLLTSLWMYPANDFDGACSEVVVPMPLEGTSVFESVSRGRPCRRAVCGGAAWGVENCCRMVSTME
jgi:hypothetical protein